MTNTNTNIDSSVDIHANSHDDSDDYLDQQNSVSASIDSAEVTETADSESNLEVNFLDDEDIASEAAVPTADNKQAHDESPEPQVKKVDIVIAGNTYQIYCPINEEEALRSAVYVINNSVLDIKAQAPNLTQENLLVLCCLNLQEKIHAQQKDVEQRHHTAEQSEMLVNKIIEDAESVLL